MLALLILAQSRGEQDPGSTGLGIGLIVGVLALLVLGAILLHFVMHRGAKASKGGVQAPRFDKDAERHPSEPPLESIEPRS